MKTELLTRILQARREKRAVVLATALNGTDAQRLVDLEEQGEPFATYAREALRTDASTTHELDGVRWFIQPFNPPLRMFVVGAVHITQPLVTLARELGYAVTVIDPREAFLREERFGGVECSHEWPDEALTRLGLDHRTAVVLLTHDPKLDDPALFVALSSSAFYIGALGSSRTHAKRVERLREAGTTDEAIQRIHAPIGLDIGAKSPAEIATSIVAQVTAVLRGRAP